jgi:hypothetical protein
VEEGFAHWLAGFVDGEGSFVIAKVNNGCLRCFLSLVLRDDDREILEEIQARIGGTLAYRTNPSATRPSSNPEMVLQVRRKADCLRLVELFDRYPLRARKRRDFAIWREAVHLWASVYHGGDKTRLEGNAAVWRQMEALRLSLNGGRSYRRAA